MFPAEGTHRIEDLVHFVEVFAVHGLVQGVESSLDVRVVQVVKVGIGFIQQRKNSVAGAEVGRRFCEV